jgi:hypothetical protein
VVGKLADVIARSRDREQRFGADEPEFRMAPARQRLRADQAAIGHGELRLEQQRYLGPVERADKVRFQPRGAAPAPRGAIRPQDAPPRPRCRLSSA